MKKFDNYVDLTAEFAEPSTIRRSPAYRSFPILNDAAPSPEALRAAIDETNFSNTFISYYTYGAAIATALDLSLRGRSDGKITLDDYMRSMWLAYGKPDGPSPAIIAKPYTLQDARDRLADVSGDRAFANDFFDKYIEGRQAPDYGSLFARAGLTLRRP